MMYVATSFECSRIAQDLQIRKVQVESVVQLFNEGNTVPFITRYRKERTGGLDEDALRQIQTRLNFVKQLNDRKQTILRSIETQGKLTDELRREIQNAPTVRRLEDLYLPFKPKKKSLATAAREKGLEPLALAIWHSDPAADNLDELMPALLNPEKQLNTVEEVKTGVQHIVAEMINETAEVRALLRKVLWRTGQVASSRNDKAPEGHGNEYKPYFQFKEAAQDIRPHRILALNRGEKESILKLNLEWNPEQVQLAALETLAEHLLKVAGKTPIPSAGKGGGKPGETSRAPETPPPENASPPTAAPEIPAPEAPPHEIAAQAPPPDLPPTDPPAIAAPLVDSLPTEPKPVLHGEVLAAGLEFRSPHAAFLKVSLHDALDRLMLPSLEREIRGELTDEAELHAIKVFAHNIRSLLMQPPLIGRRVLAIDPAFRTGCKLAALDEFGTLLDHTVIFPHGGSTGGKKGKDRDKKPNEPTAPAASAPAVPPGAEGSNSTEPTSPAPVPTSESPAPPPEAVAPPAPIEIPAVSTDSAAVPIPAPDTGSAAPAPEPPAPAVDKRAEARGKFEEFVKKHGLSIIALGNGTACRETEEFIAEAIASSLPELSYVIVSEAGASVYSVSPVAKEEFPQLDATARSAISIGRRLQDPLSELVKIDPQSLGVGLYQHDMGRRELRESLEGVVESCVNQVGVDVNTASVPLLRYVSGLNQMVAREIAEQRKQHGGFTGREQLLHVAGMGPARYTQAAGFLKIPTAANPFDRTWIHPESYPLAERILAELGYAPGVLDDKGAQAEFHAKLKAAIPDELAVKLEVGAPTVRDILQALAKPGRDPREELPPPIFKKGILKLEDLQPGMELKGTVLNVVDFGAFVDVGLKDSGLVHISQMANKYIKSPYDVVSVNDIVNVWVLKIDKDSNHVSLTMIKPGTERKPQERRPAPPRREEGGQERARPPRDRGAPPAGRGPSGPPREGQREGQPAGQGQGQGYNQGRSGGGGRPPRGRGGPPPGRGPGGPPREGHAPREGQHGTPQHGSVPPPPPPPPPPRKPRREPPKPKLTQAAIEGKAPLRTLSELAAFYAAKEQKPKEPPPQEEPKKDSPPPTEPPAVAEQKSPENAAGEPPPS
jgi:protein Tex